MEYSYEFSAYSNLGSMGWGVLLAYGILMLIFIVAMWKVFVKAGRKGWESLIPIYNIYVLTKILDKPTRWFWGMFVPFMNFVVLFIRIFVAPFRLAKKFGKWTGFGLGLLFLSIIFYPILGFGKAQYVWTTEKKEVVTA